MAAVMLVMPVGYLAAWRFGHGNYDLRAFVADFIRVEHWPPGPPWFIGILFLFNGIVFLARLPHHACPFSADGAMLTAFIWCIISSSFGCNTCCCRSNYPLWRNSL
jgi:hypothetical protein